MRVFARVCVCVLGLVGTVPGVANAAPILADGFTTCVGVTSSPNCGLLPIAPVSQTLTGQFTLDNDVALFQFVLGEGIFDFTAASTSASAVDEQTGETGFDPVLSLFLNGTLLTFPDPLAPGESFPAIAQDPTPDTEVAFPVLQLVGGSTNIYTLAVSQFGNDPSGAAPTLSTGFVQDSFPCFTSGITTECPSDVLLFEAALHPQTGDFAIALTIGAPDTAPVPEPGSLSLLALGAAAALARRRRARLEPR